MTTGTWTPNINCQNWFAEQNDDIDAILNNSERLTHSKDLIIKLKGQYLEATEGSIHPSLFW